MEKGPSHKQLEEANRSTKNRADLVSRRSENVELSQERKQELLTAIYGIEEAHMLALTKLENEAAAPSSDAVVRAGAEASRQLRRVVSLLIDVGGIDKNDIAKHVKNLDIHE